MNSPTNTSTDLKTLYDQLCTSYHAVDDFRAKLLALLPLVSGVAIFELPAQKELAVTLPVIGLVGSAITLGLLIYELKAFKRTYAVLD